MACDANELASESKCFMCASEKQLLAMQAYSAWQAWRSVDPAAPSTVAALQAASGCLACSSSHKQLLADIAYALCNLNS